jgi:hypothetical protein
MRPFVEHKIDYETWPVSRRIPIPSAAGETRAG